MTSSSVCKYAENALFLFFLYPGSVACFEKPHMEKARDMVCDWVPIGQQSPDLVWGMYCSTFSQLKWFP